MVNLVGISLKFGRRFNRVPFLPKIIRMINRVVLSCDIPIETKIDDSVLFVHHGLGVVINSGAEIGAKTKILQHVTIGGTGKKRIYGDKEIMSPIIGENVWIGSGAQILGPVIVGDKVQIAAGSIVTKDIPIGKIVAGVPAQIIGDNWLFPEFIKNKGNKV